MSIGKDRLNFNPASADTLAASDSVGAYTLDGAGTAITSTTVSGKQGLDVNLLNSLSVGVDIDGVYTLVTNLLPDSIGAIVHTRAATPAIADQIKRTTGAAASSDAVVAANVHGIDVNAFGMGYNGTTWDRLTATSGSLDVNITGSDLDVTVTDSALANTAVKSTATAISTTAAVILAAQLANRKYLSFQNLGPNAVYVGDASVTASTGMRLSNGAMLEGLRLGPAISLKALTSAGAGDLRIFEAS